MDTGEVIGSMEYRREVMEALGADYWFMDVGFPYCRHAERSMYNISFSTAIYNSYYIKRQ